jgi:hypothetical protein
VGEWPSNTGGHGASYRWLASGLLGSVVPNCGEGGMYWLYSGDGGYCSLAGVVGECGSLAEVRVGWR